MLFTTSQSQIIQEETTILADKARANGLTGAVYNSITTAYKKALQTWDSDLAAAPFCGCRNIVIIFIFACIFKKEAYICTRNEETRVTKL
jgi:hypothetical protein